MWLGHEARSKGLKVETHNWVAKLNPRFGFHSYVIRLVQWFLCLVSQGWLSTLGSNAGFQGLGPWFGPKMGPKT